MCRFSLVLGLCIYFKKKRIITKSFSLSWRSSDSLSSSWAWCSFASTSCCCRSLCFTTFSMCFWDYKVRQARVSNNWGLTGGALTKRVKENTAYSLLRGVCTVHTVSSASRRALRSPVEGWRSSRRAAASEPGCRSASPGNEKSPPSFSPPPAGFFAFLRPAETRWW